MGRNYRSMDYYLTGIQDILIYFTLIYLVVIVYQSARGLNDIYIFERKYWKRLRFLSVVTWINFILSLILKSTNLVFVQYSFLILLAVALMITIGVTRVRKNNIHGKKFKMLFFHSFTSLLLMLGWVVWAKIILGWQ